MVDFNRRGDFESLNIGYYDHQDQASWYAGIGPAITSAWQNDTTTAKILESEETRDRNEYIDTQIAAGAVPKDVVDSFSNTDINSPDQMYGTDYEGLAKYLRETKGMTEIQDRQELDDATQARGEAARESVAEIASRQGWGGRAVTMLSGGLTQAFADPVYWPTFLVGIGGAAKAAQVAKATWTAKAAFVGAGLAKGTAIEGTAEAAKQYFMYDWHRQRGYDFDTTGTIKQVMLSAGIGGGVGGLITGTQLGIALRRLAKGAETSGADKATVKALKNEARAADDIKNSPMADEPVDAVYTTAREVTEQTNTNGARRAAAQAESVRAKGGVPDGTPSARDTIDDLMDKLDPEEALPIERLDAETGKPTTIQETGAQVKEDFLIRRDAWKQLREACNL